ncbi:MAG: glycoside hydrolase family 88 protein [bacterium]|nr:glycoside hydrolase family 88 protein [bacterium]
MDNLYFDENQSAAIFTGRQNTLILGLIASHFIGEHPPLPFQFKMDFENGIRCDHTGRYDFDFGNRFPDAPIGSHCTAVGKLFCFHEQELLFAISCIGPTLCMIDGKLYYRSTPREEGLHHERFFSVKLSSGYHTFSFLSEKTPLGFGFFFGKVHPQRDSCLFLSPLPERDGQLGFVYTPPLPLERAKAAISCLSEFSWFPILGEEEGNFRTLVPEKVLGDTWYGSAFALCQIRAEGYCKLSVHAEHESCPSTGRKAEVYVLPLGKKWPSFPEPAAILSDASPQASLNVKRGHYFLIVKIQRADGKFHTTLHFKSEPDEIYGIPKVHGYSANWLYLGPFHEELPSLMDLTRPEQVFCDKDKKLFWKGAYPHSTLRVCAENELFGRWSHPMALLLYGILKTGEYLRRDDYMNYVRQDVALISAFQNYSRFDAERFGFPSLNQPLVNFDELYDCGAFGALVLECQKHWELSGSKTLVEMSARHMREEQLRHSDGIFCRRDQSIWLDDLFASVPFLLRFYQSEGEVSYLEEACSQMLLFRKYLYMEDKHVMAHVYDLKWDKSNRIPWARANGWVLFSLCELLGVLPREHSKREELLQFFHDMAEGILHTQGKHGLWHQILDDTSSYEESSSTALFLYAFARSIRKGYIRERCLTSFRKSIHLAWEGLITHAVDCHGNLYGISQSAQASYSREYYQTLPCKKNDPLGLGLLLLAGVEKCLLDEYS